MLDAQTDIQAPAPRERPAAAAVSRQCIGTVVADERAIDLAAVQIELIVVLAQTLRVKTRHPVKPRGGFDQRRSCVMLRRPRRKREVKS